MSHADRKPRVALSMGDPVGIGPEVIAKALSVAEVRAWADLVVYGDPGVIEQICREAQISVPVTTIDDPNCGTCECICVRPVSDLGSVTWASSTPSADRAQLDYIEAAVADIQSGLVDALVTAPITKASIRRAGAPWPGHTEMLAHLVGLEDTSRPVMMLVGEQLRTVPLTIHCPLSEVPGRLTSKLVRDGIDVTNRALRTYFGQSKPRIAVAGLNPHAGEGGLFGNEEAEVSVVGLERHQLLDEPVQMLPQPRLAREAVDLRRVRQILPRELPRPRHQVSTGEFIAISKDL